MQWPPRSRRRVGATRDASGSSAASPRSRPRRCSAARASAARRSFARPLEPSAYAGVSLELLEDRVRELARSLQWHEVAHAAQEAHVHVAEPVAENVRPVLREEW